ncbi:hypothetical protein RI129_006280 [Pyrocoelia pectoralis]|uniref:G-patch domain-containing protein n=1 Tax=Pyrocoelia pectoralis TaxID=417401 RepID=A0AAN7VAF4_9COLE
MSEENKKISFGFNKFSKKPNIFGKPLEKAKKVELIECLESQTIKIKDAQKKEKGPLIIPMVQSTVNILDRRKDLKSDSVQENFNEKPESELTVDELAARELIREAQNSFSPKSNKVFVLPNVTANVIEIDGKEEPTLEDYESVPIGDYGLAMLRGMGWTEGLGIGKNNKKIKMVEPPLRPKGMGLGATHSYKDQKAKPALDKNGKELTLCKGSFAKITDGKKKGCYCEVQGFDDEAGRIIVKTSLDGLILSLNEFLVSPVTKEEYEKSSKVINIVKYEEYKNKDQKRDEEHRLYESDRKNKSSHKYKKKSSRVRSSSSNEESDYEKRKTKKEMTSKDYGYKKEKHKKKSHKHKYNTSDSESDHKYNHRKDKSKFDRHAYTKR